MSEDLKALRVRFIDRMERGRLAPFYAKVAPTKDFPQLVLKGCSCFIVTTPKGGVVAAGFCAENITEVGSTVTRMKSAFPIHADAKLLDLSIAPGPDRDQILASASRFLADHYARALIFVPKERDPDRQAFALYECTRGKASALLAHELGTLYLRRT